MATDGTCTGDSYIRLFDTKPPKIITQSSYKRHAISSSACWRPRKTTMRTSKRECFPIGIFVSRSRFFFTAGTRPPSSCQSYTGTRPHIGKIRSSVWLIGLSTLLRHAYVQKLLPSLDSFHPVSLQSSIFRNALDLVPQCGTFRPGFQAHRLNEPRCCPRSTQMT